MKKIGSLPNILSLLRIGLSIPILFVPENPQALLALMLLCGMTDVLDGYLARKWKCESALGARLDSLGDLIFFAVLTVYMCLYRTGVLKAYPALLAAVIAVRLASALICRIKNGRFYGLHTIGNKVAGLSVFFGICLVMLTGSEKIAAAVLGIALVSAVEELLIMLFFKDPDMNTKSILRCRKTRPVIFL